MEEIILYAIYVLAAIITVVGLQYILMLHIFVLKEGKSWDLFYPE